MNIQGIIIVTVYLAIMVTIVLVIGKTNKTYRDFAIGNASLPWYVIGGTMTATTIGGGTLIGYVGSFYNYGWQWAWMGVGGFASLTLLTFVFAKRFRSFNVYTLPEVLELRYGVGSKYIGAVIVAMGEFSLFCAMASSFRALVSGYLGVNPTVALILGIIFFCLTASYGGFKGVAYTDAIQAVFIIIGALVLTVIVFLKSGGINAYASFEQSKTLFSGGALSGGTMFGNVIGIVGLFLAAQSIVFQRINGTRNLNDAKKASGFYTINVCICLIVLMGVIGVGASILLPAGIEGNNVIVELLTNFTHPLFASFYIAVIISAVFTTANSVLLSGVMNIARDFYFYNNKDASSEQLLSVSRKAIAVVGCISFVIVQFYPSVIGIILFMYTTQTCLLIPLYIGLFLKKPGSSSGFLSLLLSLIAALVWQIMGSPYGVHAVFVALGTGAIGFIIGMFGKESTLEQKEVVVNFKLCKISGK